MWSVVVVLPVVQNDFGATRGTASLAFTLVMLGFGSGGVLTGKVEKLLDPARQDAKCDKCTDDRKDQPVLGMTLIKGVKQNADHPERWDGGEILDPNKGKTYKVRITPVDGGKTLEVRGYIGAPLLGRTQTWSRVE